LYIPINVVYTHDDFDGLGSAALFMHHFKAGQVMFSNPKRIPYEPIGEKDAVLDLPFGRRCAMWFDHHEQNFEEPRYHGLEPDSIPGLRMPAHSCARVILTYYERASIPVPGYFEPLGREIDRFDAMIFASLAEWLEESPGKVVTESLVLPNESVREREGYYRFLIDRLLRYPLADCVEDPQIRNRYLQKKKLNDSGREVLRKISGFHPADQDRRVLILDFSNLKFQPAVDKKLALIDFPEVDYIMSIYPFIENRVKTNTISISIGRNFLKHAENGAVAWGEFFARKEIGGGHRDAAGARLESRSKAEKDKQLEALTQEILRLLP